MKGITIDELTAAATVMRKFVNRIKLNKKVAIDTCGTGGDKKGTINISSISAIIVAAAGVTVAKHGNRSVSSNCGSADLLEALGVKLQIDIDKVKSCIETVGIGFMFAPAFHPAMKYVQPIRQSLDFRTAFNILGPLANPAGAAAQVMGVPEESLMHRIAEALNMLGVKRAMVVHSAGLDEISTMAKTEILHLNNGQMTTETLDPTEYGIALTDFDTLKGGDAKTNAEIIRGILSGTEQRARKDIVVLNAAAAIIVAGLANDFRAAIELADEAVAKQKALAALEKLIEISNS